MRTDISEFRGEWSLREHLFHGARILCPIVGLQQARDDNDAAGPCFDYGCDVVQLYAAYTENRDPNGLMDPADIVETDRRVLGLRRGGENGPDRKSVV